MKRFVLVLLTLMACAPAPGQRAVAVGKLDGDVGRGEGVFLSHCAVCHGPLGQGTDAGVALPEHFSEHRVEELALILIDGSGAMPPQPGLSDQELADVIAYGRVKIAQP